MNQKGIAHLLLPVVVLLIIGVAAYFLINLGIINNPLPQSLQQLTKQEPTVALKNDYKNPFEKETQYVNPFDQYKSPFHNLKKSTDE